MTRVGAGAIGLRVAGNGGTAEASLHEIPPGEPHRVTLTVNGTTHRILIEPRETLLYVLRERLGMTATKPGCERGECGACTVLIDGATRYACLTLAVEAEGHDVTTLEGLTKGEEPGAVQQAFIEEDAFQCGYCTPGQIVAAEGLLRARPDPTLEEIRTGMSGNLCRCGAYVHIFRAVKKASVLKKSAGR
jgi:xanthine dehydrogenase YagT iron-sulfur-binding subunit